MLIDRRTVFSGRVINLTVDSVELPNGVRTSLEVIHHPGGAAIAAVDAADRVCLLRQYRYAAGGYIWELPAGKLEPNAPPPPTLSLFTPYPSPPTSRGESGRRPST